MAGIVLSVGLALVPAVTASASDSTAQADSIYGLVNAARAQTGLQPLIHNLALEQVAQAWAAQMAASNTMSHNPSMTSQIPSGWTTAGENVARGQADGLSVHNAWMNSPGHRANILGNYTDIGIAFLSSGGTTWSVEVFAGYANHVSPQATAFVKSLYADVLGRSAGAPEIESWSRQLASGVSATTVASGFVGSDEYRLGRIMNAYRSSLGREGETTGVFNWLDLMKRGVVDTDDVDKYFMASDEYLLRSGGTLDSFIASMYAQQLGRQISSSEMPFWQRIAGAYGRLAVVDGIWHSVEAARSRVTLMYSAYLGRTPDEAGVASWANIALAGGDAAVRWQIIGSAEYWNRSSARFPTG
ncbi:MAG: DUF4214 domain-containing protein [Candidatus Saccharibacteria bacterium]|nr:DUF4214 domain-containing protein [Microbacteriaceae bacterium]